MNHVKKLFPVLFLIFTPVILNAQTEQEALEAYNEGASLIADDKMAAIAAFEKSLDIFNSLGVEGNDKQELIQSKLPDLYYNVALDHYRAKEHNDAMSMFQKTIEIAKKYDDPVTEQKAGSALARYYNSFGGRALKNENFEEALKYFNDAVDLDPTLAKAYFYIGYIHEKQDNIEEMISAYDKAIENGLAGNESDVAENANERAIKKLVIEANNAKNAENYDQAIELLQKAKEYNNQYSEVHYLMAVVYNAREKWENAIESAKKAIKYEEGGENLLARDYFELGDAYLGAGMEQEACDAYSKANTGDYAVSAQYQMEHVLKCE
ncbi:MAG: tetratricopeptide repeat protein [bacterium]